MSTLWHTLHQLFSLALALFFLSIPLYDTLPQTIILFVQIFAPIGNIALVWTTRPFSTPNEVYALIQFLGYMASIMFWAHRLLQAHNTTLHPVIMVASTVVLAILAELIYYSLVADVGPAHLGLYYCFHIWLLGIFHRLQDLSSLVLNRIGALVIWIRDVFALIADLLALIADWISDQPSSISEELELEATHASPPSYSVSVSDGMFAGLEKDVDSLV